MNNHTWRLIEDGPGDGKLNMAIDRAILTACDRGQAPATLRLYGWDKPTLSIGYSQNKLRDVDTVQCERRNISIVRRFTGGRALLHQYELTYSLVAPIPHPRFPGNLAGAFGAVSKAVIFSLAAEAREEHPATPALALASISSQDALKGPAPAHELFAARHRHLTSSRIEEGLGHVLNGVPAGPFSAADELAAPLAAEV